MTPADEDINRPDPRPVDPGAAVDKGLPQLSDRDRIETAWRNRLRIAHGLIHHLLQALPDPAIERQHESALGPIEQRRIEAAQTDPPQHVLAAER